MMISTASMVSMTEANKNFSQVAHRVDQQGSAVIMKNNKPRYALIGFEEYEQLRKDKIMQSGDRILTKYARAFEELSK